MTKSPPPFLKKIMLSRREIKLILVSVELTEEDMSVPWKAEMVSKLKRAIKRRRRKKKVDKVVEENKEHSKEEI